MAGYGKARELVQRSATAPSVNLSPSPIMSQIPVLNKPLRSYSFKPKRLRLARLDFSFCSCGLWLTRFHELLIKERKTIKRNKAHTSYHSTALSQIKNIFMFPAVFHELQPIELHLIKACTFSLLF